MPVAMVQVRQMRVRMGQRRMLVPVRVRLCALVAAVRVLVMLVVGVAVTVCHVLVAVLMCMPLREYQPRRGQHQYQGGGKRGCKRLSHGENRDRGADERRGAEMRGGACRSQMPQREDEQHEAHAVAQESNSERRRERSAPWRFHAER